MDGSNFDRLTQAVARTTSRRGFLAVLGGLLPLAASGAKAAQLGPASCGQSGDVCTMLIGCCSGFTCATSSINVNYGVCVSGGSGGTVTTGTSLISPFSKSIEQEVAALAADPALTATGTTTSTIDARKADIQARKDARKTTRDSRRSTRKTTIQSRRTTRKTERTADEEAARVDAGPILEGQIFNPGVGSGSTREVLRVTNRDVGPITLVSIESLTDPGTRLEFVDGRLPVLQVGQTYDFFSELFDETTSGTDGDSTGSGSDNLGTRQIGWTSVPICVAGAGPSAGFRVFVSFSADAANHAYSFLCTQPFTPAPTADDSGGADRRRKRKRQMQQQSKKQRNKKSRGKQARNKGKR